MGIVVIAAAALAAGYRLGRLRPWHEEVLTVELSAVRAPRGQELLSR
ncbi:hypothetical protein ACIA98_38375 [Streptomyces sp. NPDC051366]